MDKMKTAKIIIAGGRNFTDEALLEKAVKYYVSEWNLQEAIIISGAARGADTLGEKLANKYELKVEKYPADWETHGRSAGYKRNSEMAEAGTHLIAFWDTASRGTKHMIDTAKKAGLITAIVLY